MSAKQAAVLAAARWMEPYLHEISERRWLAEALGMDPHLPMRPREVADRAQLRQIDLGSYTGTSVARAALAATTETFTDRDPVLEGRLIPLLLRLEREIEQLYILTYWHTQYQTMPPAAIPDPRLYRLTRERAETLCTALDGRMRLVPGWTIETQGAIL